MTQRNKRPYYDTDLEATIAIDGCWYSCRITGLAFPAHPSSPKPDVPVSCDVEIGSDKYKIEILRYQDEMIWGKIGVSKDAQRVLIVV